MKHVYSALLGATALLLSSPSYAETTLTIATVNNSDMIRMQGLTSDFTAKNPDITTGPASGIQSHDPTGAVGVPRPATR